MCIRDRSKDDILEAAKLYKKPQDFFSHIEGISKGKLCDVGTKNFRETAEHFMDCLLYTSRCV